VSKWPARCGARPSRGIRHRTIPTGRRRRSQRLPLDLRGIDGITRIGRPDDGCTLILLPSVNRGSRRRGGHICHSQYVGDAAKSIAAAACPTDFLGHRIGTARCFGCLESACAECDRSSPRHAQFVHETFQIDRVVIDIDAAPEAGRDVRVAHRMLDQEIRHRISRSRPRPVALGTGRRRVPCR